MSEDVTTHPLREQFDAHQEAALAERAENQKDYLTGLERLAAEGRLEEQFSAEEAAQIEADLGVRYTIVEEADLAPAEPVEVVVPEETPEPVATEVVPEVTPEEIQEDLDHGRDEAEEVAAESVVEPEPIPEPEEVKPAPKPRAKPKAKPKAKPAE